MAPLQVFFNIFFELLSGRTLISFASSELTLKQIRRYVVTVHSNDMSHPAKLSFRQINTSITYRQAYNDDA